MDDSLKRPQPKKIKMPPLVDRSQAYDTLSFDNDTLYEISKTIDNEDNPEIDSQSISELESM
jgi:hypothetical protein